MLSLSQIEQDLAAAIKSRNSLAVDVLRAVKTRIQNEQIAKMTASSGKELQEADIVALIKSEAKRRKEAAQAYQEGGRPELAEKELKEAEVLVKYLPAQMSEEQIKEAVEKAVAENNFTAKDFGAAMGKLKSQLGSQADGAVLAKLLKEKLTNNN